MRIVPNADGEFLIIMADNHVCSFVGARPNRTHEAPPARMRTSVAESMIAAWTGLAGSLQRGVRFGRTA